MTANFALIGAAGYVAPRHLKAIRETGGTLCAALDVSDSVGVLDSYFPEAAFFTDIARFEDHLRHPEGRGDSVDFVSVCSPNHLHKAHVSLALDLGADVICEKPLVLDVADLDWLADREKESGRRVNTILQLRLHPSILALRDQVAAGPENRVHDVDLGYFTARGPWYHASWKGDVDKSGGIATNIGVHFLDMLHFVFGRVRENIVHHRGEEAAAGYLEFDRARVRWLLSINRAHLPPGTPDGQTTFRRLTLDGEEVDFTSGFTDLHTESYRDVLGGGGFGIVDVRPSVEIVSAMRHAPVESGRGERHPDLKRILAK